MRIEPCISARSLMTGRVALVISLDRTFFNESPTVRQAIGRSFTSKDEAADVYVILAANDPLGRVVLAEKV